MGQFDMWKLEKCWHFFVWKWLKLSLSFHYKPKSMVQSSWTLNVMKSPSQQRQKQWPHNPQKGWHLESSQHLAESFSWNLKKKQCTISSSTSQKSENPAGFCPWRRNFRFHFVDAKRQNEVKPSCCVGLRWKGGPSSRRITAKLMSCLN